MTTIETKNLLNKMYVIYADALIAKEYEDHTLKGSNAKFHLYRPSRYDKWVYQLQFKKIF